MSSFANVAFLCFSIFNLFHFSDAKALSVPPSVQGGVQGWYGDDGQWSAVQIRVGTPRQFVDVFVSTALSETWVVDTNGCDSTSICRTDRGGLFGASKSITWQEDNQYELGAQLGFTGNGDYGLDVLELSTTGVALNNSVIARINTTDYWLGYLGLGVVSGAFPKLGQVNSTLLNLGPVHEGITQSLSYGYTAGAVYQQKGEPCSLTFGGYDANRLVLHNNTFTLNSKVQPEAFLNGVSVNAGTRLGNSSAWASNPLPLVKPTDAVSVIIDSSKPFLELPKAICETFATALGLTYNSSLQLYTFDANTTKHTDLLAMNLTFTFSFTDTASSPSSSAVNITLPYAAFDLALSYPFIPNTTFQGGSSKKNYFPLRQSNDSNRYVLGRSFLQEAYIVTDYDRNAFGLYQAVHVSDPLNNVSLVDIIPPDTMSNPGGAGGSNGGKTLSPGAIAGIVVGAVVVLIALGIAGYVLWRRHHPRISGSEVLENPSTTAIGSLNSPKDDHEITITSASGSSYASPLWRAGTHDAQTPAPPVEAADTEIHMAGSTEIHELPAELAAPTSAMSTPAAAYLGTGRQREADNTHDTMSSTNSSNWSYNTASEIYRLANFRTTTTSRSASSGDISAPTVSVGNSSAPTSATHSPYGIMSAVSALSQPPSSSSSTAWSSHHPPLPNMAMSPNTEIAHRAALPTAAAAESHSNANNRPLSPSGETVLSDRSPPPTYSQPSAFNFPFVALPPGSGGPPAMRGQRQSVAIEEVLHEGEEVDTEIDNSKFLVDDIRAMRQEAAAAGGGNRAGSRPGTGRRDAEGIEWEDEKKVIESRKEW